MALGNNRNRLGALLVLMLGGAVAYGLLVGKPGPAPEVAPVMVAPTVDIVTAAPSDQALSVHTQGTVRPLREIRLISQVGGLVETVSANFRAGSFFRAQDVLLKIEDVDYELQIARAEAQVAGARQTLAEEQGRALQARREWRNLGSEEANALFLRKPQIAAAEASLRAAQADLETARLNLARTAISVPFNGRVSEKHVDIGQYVSPGAHLATVYATDAVEVRLPLTGRQVALLDLPLNYDDDVVAETNPVPVVLRAPFANREWEWQGHIVRTDASIDESSRVVYAVAEVLRPFSKIAQSERPPLSPGLFVNAQIVGRVLPDVVELPRPTVGNDNTVMVVDASDKVIEKSVDVLDSAEGRVWVQGLEPGDRIILDRPPRLVSGMKVRTRDGELAGAND